MFTTRAASAMVSPYSLTVWQVLLEAKDLRWVKTSGDRSGGSNGTHLLTACKTEVTTPSEWSGTQSTCSKTLRGTKEHRIKKGRGENFSSPSLMPLEFFLLAGLRMPVQRGGGGVARKDYCMRASCSCGWAAW